MSNHEPKEPFRFRLCPYAYRIRFTAPPRSTTVYCRADGRDRCSATVCPSRLWCGFRLLLRSIIEPRPITFNRYRSSSTRLILSPPPPAHPNVVTRGKQWSVGARALTLLYSRACDIVWNKNPRTDAFRYRRTKNSWKYVYQSGKTKRYRFKFSNKIPPFAFESYVYVQFIRSSAYS